MSTRPMDLIVGGKPVDVAYLNQGFSWKKYVPTVTKADKWITVQENYISTSTGQLRHSKISVS